MPSYNTYDREYKFWPSFIPKSNFPTQKKSFQKDAQIVPKNSIAVSSSVRPGRPEDPAQEEPDVGEAVVEGAPAAANVGHARHHGPAAAAPSLALGKLKKI